jgi:hypothetical protein
VRSVMPARPEPRVDPEPAPWAAHRRGLVGYRAPLGPRPARPAPAAPAAARGLMCRRVSGKFYPSQLTQKEGIRLLP